MNQFEHGGNVYAHPGCTDFSASLNPLGMPASVRSTLVNSVDSFSCYPEPTCRELACALSVAEGVKASKIVVCAGATDAFARICAIAQPREALVCAPCYAGYEQALAQVGARVRYHELSAADDFSVDMGLVQAIDHDIDLVFVANPNNPTGRCVEREVLRACLDAAAQIGVLVVLDECFIDLTNKRGSTDLLHEYSNLLLVKAFTKTYALAGLRLGYVLCGSAELAQRIIGVGQPWAVSVPAQLAGTVCLSDTNYLARSRELILSERLRLSAAIRDLGLYVVPSDANYVLFRGPCGLYQALLAHGVIVRPCANFRGLDEHWYRVAIRTPSENDLLLHALERSVEEVGT